MSNSANLNPGAGVLWVFGYGSLMWNPGFANDGKHTVRLKGYHRAYMMYSTRNRGTSDLPGMVLSLAPGGECTGTAFAITPGQEEEALAYLDKREGVGRAHRRVIVPVQFLNEPGSPWKPVMTFLPILTYTNYIPQVPLSRQAELIATGKGTIGASYDYLRLLMEELQQMQLKEPVLEQLFSTATDHRNHVYQGNPPPPGL